MRATFANPGFSLVEILVSLIIVSLVAVNIAGLQKIVTDQSRDNLSHVAVIELLTTRFEEIGQMSHFQDITNFNGTSEDYVLRGIEYTIMWRVEIVSSVSNILLIHHVEARVTWLNAIGEIQLFSYAEQVSQAILSEGDSVTNSGRFPYVIPNLLNTTKVNYFESKAGYEKDAYIIYDSQLFQATSVHSLENGGAQVTVPPINHDGDIANGWIHLGRIDNADLATLFAE